MKQLSILLSTTLLILFLFLSFTPKKNKQPNVVFIIIDDHRWDALSSAGHPFVETPNIDKIRNEGVLFQNAFVTNSLCSPSRASFLTGAYPHKHGVINNEQREFNPDLTPSFPQILQKNGYRTGFVGKWHMAFHSEPRVGFDYWLSVRGQGEYNNPELNENGKIIKSEGYITDIFTKYAVDFLEKDSESPFCLVLSHKAVHEPFTPSEKHKGQFKDIKIPEPKSWKDDLSDNPAWMRAYYLWEEMEGSTALVRRGFNHLKETPDSIAITPWEDYLKKRGDQFQKYFETLLSVDESVGQIYKTLEERGELDNTIFVYAGDNGYFLGEHRRHDKRYAYDESMRIPFFIRFPQSIESGSTIEQIVLNQDLAPTILDYCNLEIPKTVQGKSIRPLIENDEAEWRDSFLYEYYVDLVPYIPRMLSLRTEDWKYISYPDINDIDELYDLKNDPNEINNLALNSGYIDQLSKMKVKLDKKMKETGYTENVDDVSPGIEKYFNQKLAFDYDFAKTAENMLIDQSDNKINAKMNKVKIQNNEPTISGYFNSQSSISIPSNKNLQVWEKPWMIELYFKPFSDGVVLEYADNKSGLSFFVENGKPSFAVKSTDWRTTLIILDGTEKCINEWTHLVGKIDGRLAVFYVNGEPIDTLIVPSSMRPIDSESFIIGQNDSFLVYNELINAGFNGEIKTIRLSQGRFSNNEIRNHAIKQKQNY